MGSSEKSSGSAMGSNPEYSSGFLIRPSPNGRPPDLMTIGDLLGKGLRGSRSPTVVSGTGFGPSTYALPVGLPSSEIEVSPQSASGFTSMLEHLDVGGMARPGARPVLRSAMEPAMSR